MDGNNTPTDELIKQAITLIGTLAGLYLTRKFMAPDFGVTFKMRTALVVKHVAQNQADMWQTLAHNAGTVYNKARV